MLRAIRRNNRWEISDGTKTVATIEPVGTVQDQAAWALLFEASPYMRDSHEHIERLCREGIAQHPKDWPSFVTAVCDIAHEAAAKARP